MLNISCPDCYIKVDFLRKENEHLSPNVEPLMAEHNNFIESILVSDLKDVTYKQEYLVD
jgi:hypothetical protein